MQPKGPKISLILDQATENVNLELGDYLSPAQLAKALIEVVDAYGDKGSVRDAVATWLYQTHRVSKPHPKVTNMRVEA